MDSAVLAEKLESLRNGLDNARKVADALRAELTQMERNIVATEGAISVLSELLQQDASTETK